MAWNSAESAIETCIRSGLNAARKIEDYNKRYLGIGRPDIVILIDNKRYANVAGSGKVYEDFLKTKEIGQFTGKESPAKLSTEIGYKKGLLQVMEFDDCFKRVHTDPRNCEYIL